MTGGKSKQKNIYNINQLNLEIDYDKLAEAIVKAQEKAKKGLIKPTEKVKFFPAIWKILKGERSKDGRFLSEPYKLIIGLIYRAIAIVGFILLLLFDIAFVIELTKLSWHGLQIGINIIAAITILATSITLFLYMLIFWGAANDIKYEENKEYVINVFSGLISVAALVVAIIALFKGIG